MSRNNTTVIITTDRAGRNTHTHTKRIYFAKTKITVASYLIRKTMEGANNKMNDNTVFRNAFDQKSEK